MKRRIFFIVASISLGGIIGLFLVEIFFRIFAPQIDSGFSKFYHSNEYYTYGVFDGFTADWKTEEWDFELITDEHGFRRHDYDPDREDLVSIMGVGDSYFFGYGVEDDQLYSHKLLDLLGGGYQTMSYGVPGWSTVSERQFIEYALDENPPDILILGFYLNDIRENHIWDHLKVNDGLGVPYLDDEGLRIRKRTYYLGDCDQLTAEYSPGLQNKGWYRWIFAKLHTAQFIGRVKYQLLDAPDMPNEISDEYSEEAPTCSGRNLLDKTLLFTQEGINLELDSTLEEAWQKTQNELDRIIEWTSNHDVKFILLNIPYRFVISPTEQSKDLFFNEYKNTYFDLERISNQISTYCESRNIVCLDPTKDMYGLTELYFEVDGHLNAAGHVFIAEYLYDYLTQEF